MSEISILERRFPGRRAGLKREILLQALACFNESGIEATTIDAIKARCETSVGAIYHHFGNKEGILGALFFTALDDQHEHFVHYLERAGTLEEVVFSVVLSYVDWVVKHPDWARFQFQARSSIVKGPHYQELKERNTKTYRELKEKFAAVGSAQKIAPPFELLPSLIIGASENYCRAWLSGRVQTSPKAYGEQLASAAWRSIQG
ncbi:TetR/AcrR family transcriptional regulator [Marinobacter sp. SS21]|uniref:TetR/AcrR family transcriptional regulator n=1 Tax=Marinobacter sp. SS21 TaxID=2979460 RepID=UPI002330ADD7|nr:TetR/AcrR family transcriptional regulator [Marinobacter sp. SS21]MDC0663808.1 TetR/AcrR family transcriptional regulator [Marinobacter sp. SS21]